MNTRDQFGNYLLLKRLGEDAVGETFRAGRVARGALERVVLLRVLNGQGFDPERIARSLQARAGLAQALKSPNIGHAIDVGQVRGVPYIAYDYASGRTLGQLLEQGARRNSPLPLDHALLIAERVALALAVGHETRLGEERVQHGFVTPGFVHVSNEGELKLLGFEASSGLRESAAHPIVKQAVGRYLSPETVAGQPASRADDVYSVGALLFEMMTGQQVPLMPASGLGPVLDSATLAEGGPIHPEVAALLRRTLCPREQRVADMVAWHKSLAKVIADGGFGATTFNLAFFLHNLFRDEIDREGRELESEKTQATALIAGAAAPRATEATATTTAGAVREAGPIREDTSVLRDAYGIPAKKPGNSGVLIGAGVGAVAILAVVGWLLLGRKGPETPLEPAPEAAAAPAPAEPAPEAAAAEPAPTGMTPEQIQALIDQALSNQKKQIEAGVKAQTDEQIRALQQQLADAQKSRSAAPAPAQPSPARIESLTDAPGTSRAQLATQNPQPAPVAPAPSPRVEEPRPSAVNPPATTTAKPAAPAPAPAQAAPGATTAEAGTVRPGELVTFGPGVVPPRVARTGQLAYPALAKRMKREATVTVRVLVDENGRPVEVQPTGDKAGFGLDEAAVQYARACQFEPARKHGVKVRMWYDLKVSFTLGG